MDLALNNLKWLICNKTKLNKKGLRICGVSSGGVVCNVLDFILVREFKLQSHCYAQLRTHQKRDSPLYFPNYDFNVIINVLPQ